MNAQKITLHRYFIWADRMRAHFDEINKSTKTPLSETSNDFIESFMYMSLWYGLLYVVIEGWRELKLEDSKIDELLESQNVDALRLYRNAVFHFQKDYFNRKQQTFMSSPDAPVEWVRELNQEFGRYFLDEIKRSKEDGG